MKLLGSVLVGSAYSSSCGSSYPELQNCNCYSTVVDCSNKGLKAIPGSFPRGKTRLDLSYNNINYVNELPDELEDLVDLNLSHNNIREIHFDAFDGLDNLENLNLAYNQLNEIEDDIFQWNPVHLKTLDLSNNKFEFIQHFLFYDLQEIQEINLSDNDLFFVHPHAFDELKRLRTLNLANNKLTEFKSKWFTSIIDDNLQEVMLDGNPWACDCDLQNEKNFLQNPTIKRMMTSFLERGGSSLKCNNKDDTHNLGMDMFNWSSLSSKLTPCTPPKITGISKSSTVDAGKMLLLKCLAEGVPQPKIEWKAPNGDVYRLQSEDFEGITVHQDGALLIEDLRKADQGIYRCVATNSAGSMEASTKITVTGSSPFDDNDRDDYDEDDLDEDGWEYDRDDNEWKKTRDDYEWIDGGMEKNGQRLDSNDYHLPGINNEDFEFDNDYRIDIDSDCPANCECSSSTVDCSDAENVGDSGRALTKIPIIKSHYTHLDMTLNKVPEIEKGLCRKMKQIRELKVDSNRIKNIENGAFSDCGDLRILTMRDNRLDELRAQMFDGLDNVQILVLDHNFLKTIPSYAFQGMDNLEYLYLKNNKIEKIESQAFYGLKKLKFIHLEDNKLDHLDMDWVKEAVTNTKLERIFIDGNNLVCDTRLKPFKDHFENSKTSSKIYNVFQPTELKCSSPPELIGKTLNTINYNELVVVTPIEGGSSGGPGFMFGGVFLGAVLAVLGFIGWRQWNRRNSMKGGYGYSYTDDQEVLV
ncbi:Oidioi.mRNA.OKI2018_I69.chr2.g8296.t1.cds [Oikopleura dioica]|uniref:Oidioi.mRNA.OKI2018_I69.chr2.g8296.t1.cds n=1 Tax=Oikopleura dioica TaxID=34765 RepID=A0ABN7T8T3_OIKDI|nr:Oidioi.mRNA.OKI2018_I69.chr2.g8296.t1.cds [Oikopleura dioica]